MGLIDAAGLPPRGRQVPDLEAARSSRAGRARTHPNGGWLAIRFHPPFCKWGDSGGTLDPPGWHQVWNWCAPLGGNDRTEFRYPLPWGSIGKSSCLEGGYV